MKPDVELEHEIKCTGCGRTLQTIDFRAYPKLADKLAIIRANKVRTFEREARAKRLRIKKLRPQKFDHLGPADLEAIRPLVDRVREEWAKKAREGARITCEPCGITHDLIPNEFHPLGCTVAKSRRQPRAKEEKKP